MEDLEGNSRLLEVYDRVILCPLFFTIVADVLSRLMEKAQEFQLIKAWWLERKQLRFHISNSQMIQSFSWMGQKEVGLNCWNY
jgi:hypothetical protein